MRKSNSPLWSSMTQDKLQGIANQSVSLGDMIRKLGLKANSNYVTLRKYIRELGVSTSHFLENPKARGIHPKRPLEEILVEGSTFSRWHLKRRILEENLLPYVCASCGNDGTWFGRDLSLELEHKNGISDDHRLENLEFLCPNCHSQTPTFSGKKRI